MVTGGVVRSQFYGCQAFARICAIDRIDTVVTGTGADATVVSALADVGIDVRLVDY